MVILPNLNLSMYIGCLSRFQDFSDFWGESALLHSKRDKIRQPYLIFMQFNQLFKIKLPTLKTNKQ